MSLCDIFPDDPSCAAPEPEPQPEPETPTEEEPVEEEGGEEKAARKKRVSLKVKSPRSRREYSMPFWRLLSGATSSS